ncbi:hypothetical protein Tco_1189291 [Tanacetum coccineum]
MLCLKLSFSKRKIWLIRKFTMNLLCLTRMLCLKLSFSKRKIWLIRKFTMNFQSNKPCKNLEFPEFREFFVINDLKAQLLARTTLICNADIGLVNDDEPFAEVQLTALHNILANEQQHTKQSEPSYDTHLLIPRLDRFFRI